jgi:hypothetical protein
MLLDLYLIGLEEKSSGNGDEDNNKEESREENLTMMRISYKINKKREHLEKWLQ